MRACIKFYECNEIVFLGKSQIFAENKHCWKDFMVRMTELF